MKICGHCKSFLRCVLGSQILLGERTEDITEQLLHKLKDIPACHKFDFYPFQDFGNYKGTGKLNE